MRFDGAGEVLWGAGWTIFTIFTLAAMEHWQLVERIAAWSP